MNGNHIELSQRRVVLLIAGFALLCWGRVLSMKGMWWDDWWWAWHYFGMEPDKFIVLGWLREMSARFMLFSFLSAFDFLGSYTFYIWSILRLIIFTANALLLYAILDVVLRKKTILPVVIALAYVAAPAVNNLTLLLLKRHLFLFFYLLSVWLSAKAIEGEKVRFSYYLLALPCAVFSMASHESLVSFDIFRFAIFLYIFLGKGKVFKKALGRSILLWAPFAFAGAAIVLDVIRHSIWSPSVTGFTGGHPLDLIINILSSMKYVFDSIYTYTLRKALIKDTDLVAILIAFASVAFFLFSMRKINIMQNDEATLREAKIVAAIGFIAVPVGLYPYCLMREAASYGIDSRHALLANFGASIFFPSFLMALHMSKRIKKKFFLALLCAGFFIGTLQCNYAVGMYKYYWEQQRSIWWQMIWRAPDIRENTFMIIDMPWHESPGGGSFTLPAEFNLAYAKSLQKEEIYSHYAVSLHNAFRRDVPYSYRDIHDRDVITWQSYLGKLKFYPKNLIAASYRDGYLYINEEITDFVMERDEDVAFMVSNTTGDRILYEAGGKTFPLRWILGSEPEHDWKYYCQKANALSGGGDNEGVDKLFREARTAGYDLKEVAPHCLFPFVAAYRALGNNNVADTLFEAWVASSSGKHKMTTLNVKN